MEELELGQHVMGKKLFMSRQLFTHAQEMQHQMEELELGQHVMGKKLFMSDNCSRMRRRCSDRWKS
jgi:hypothetical protein